MKKIILTAFVACTVGLAFAESGTYESIAGGTTSVTTNDFGNNKYSISNAIYTDLPPSSRTNVMFVKSVTMENDGHEEEQI